MRSTGGAPAIVITSACVGNSSHLFQFTLHHLDLTLEILQAIDQLLGSGIASPLVATVSFGNSMLIGESCLAGVHVDTCRKHESTDQ